MEDIIAVMLDQLDDSLRIATPTDFRDVFLARTAIKPGGTYPGSGNTFWIEFLDGYFTDASGAQTPTWETRGLADGVHAHNIDNEYVNEGTMLFAVWQQGTNDETDGEWWFQRAAGGGGGTDDLFLCNFTLTTTLALGGTATATVNGCSDSVATEFSSTITVEDTIGKFKGASGYKGMAWKYKSDTGCNWQIVELEEQAEIAKVTSNAKLSGAEEATVTAVVNDSWQGKDPGAVYTIEDELGIYGNNPASSKFITSYDEVADRYKIIDGKQAPAASEECLETTGRGTLDEVGWAIVQEANDNDWPVDEIRINRDTCMRGFYNANDDVLLIGIDPSEREGSVLFSDAAQVRWTDGPKIGHHLTVGSDQGASDGESYVKIKGNTQANHDGVWALAVGNNSHGTEEVWLMPTARASEASQHLIVEKTGAASTPAAPECIQLKWSDQGLTASAWFETSGGNVCKMEFTDGILTGISEEMGSPACSDNTPTTTHDATCDLQEATEQDPCDSPNG